MNDTKQFSELRRGDVIRHPDTGDWEIVERKPNPCEMGYDDCPPGCVEYSARDSMLIEHWAGGKLVEVATDPAVKEGILGAELEYARRSRAEARAMPPEPSEPAKNWREQDASTKYHRGQVTRLNDALGRRPSMFRAGR